jgi:hypothetical protein
LLDVVIPLIDALFFVGLLRENRGHKQKQEQQARRQQNRQSIKPIPGAKVVCGLHRPIPHGVKNTLLVFEP